MDDDNIIQFGKPTVDPSKVIPEVSPFPTNEYVVRDIDDEIFYASGFLIFTDTHVGVMTPTPQGAIPAFLIPISRLKYAELDDADDDDDESDLFA